jgi:hypothetical protein
MAAKKKISKTRKKSNQENTKKKSQKSKSSRSKSAELNMDFISMRTLANLSVDARIEQILNKVKEGHIVVLDSALDADEEAKLVTATMHGIEGEFTGIEFCTLPSTSTNNLYSFFTRVIETVFKKSVTKPGLTFVGPSAIITKIKRDPDAFYVSTKGD